jgi:hypothetical protein
MRAFCFIAVVVCLLVSVVNGHIGSTEHSHYSTMINWFFDDWKSKDQDLFFWQERVARGWGGSRRLKAQAMYEVARRLD